MAPKAGLSVDLKVMLADLSGSAETLRQQVYVQTERVMEDFAEYVRAEAHRSIVPSPESAPPGSPPRSHTGELRDGLGKTRVSHGHWIVFVEPRGSSRTPRVLEEGGLDRIKVRKIVRDPTTGRLAWREVEMVVYKRARPYLSPALEKGEQKVPSFIRKHRRF